MRVAPLGGAPRPVRLLAPLLWMAAIFLLSGDSFSSAQTSRFIIPLLQRLFPAASFDTLDQIHEIIRKGAHVLEYGLLSLLWYWSLAPLWSEERASFSLPLLAFSLTLAYAFFDEFHQSKVSSRMGCVQDVLVDGSGALLLQILLGYGTHRRKAKTPPIPSEREGRGS